MLFDDCDRVFNFCCSRVPSGSIVTLDINVHSLRNPQFMNDGERVVTSVGGFETGFALGPGVYLVDVSYPVPAMNSGTDGSLVVEFETPLPVDSGSATLATVSFLVINQEPALPEVGPTIPCHYVTAQTGAAVTGFQFDVATPTSRAGRIAIIDADDLIDPVVVLDNTLANGDWAANHNAYEVRFQEPPVGGASHSWGTIKSLYR